MGVKGAYTYRAEPMVPVPCAVPGPDFMIVIDILILVV